MNGDDRLESWLLGGILGFAGGIAMMGVLFLMNLG
jgi:hypothetical protein